MAQKRARFTFIDLLIILVIIAAAAFAVWRFAPDRSASGTKASFTVMLTAKDDAFLSAMHIGDKVYISNKEKDTGVIAKIEAKPAESLQFDSMDGKYVLSEIKNKNDILVTIEADASETDTMITVGSTPVKVGLEMPVRGKGYASMGYIVTAVAEGGKQK